MSAITSIIIATAAQVGAPLVKGILEKHVGGLAGSLAGSVIDQIAGRVGVEPDALPDADPKEIGSAINAVEAAMPEIVALYQRGLEGQFGLLQAEQAEGFWQSGWRWGWMYLLAFFWLCAFLIYPLLRLFGVEIQSIDTAILMTLTGWFIGLYMGGHTVKEIGKQAVEAFKTWRGR